MGSASIPSLHLPTFFAKAHTQERSLDKRPIARLYASVKISVNESRNGSRGTTSELPTIRESVLNDHKRVSQDLCPLERATKNRAGQSGVARRSQTAKRALGTE